MKMKQSNLLIKKDFLNLLKGDEIEVSTDSDGRIYFTVVNRKEKVRFYGNKNGRWGADNPRGKSNKDPDFILIDEFIGRKDVIVFGKIPSRPKHPTKETSYADNTDNWNEKWIDKIINDLKSVGVL